nr:hypothetical protein [Tanacetum cinerariifolium]
KFLGLTFDSTELYKHHKASVASSGRYRSRRVANDIIERVILAPFTEMMKCLGDVDEGVPTELTGACTAGVGETGLLARGGSRHQKNRSGSCTEMHRSHWLN